MIGTDETYQVETGLEPGTFGTTYTGLVPIKFNRLSQVVLRVILSSVNKSKC